MLCAATTTDGEPGQLIHEGRGDRPRHAPERKIVMKRLSFGFLGVLVLLGVSRGSAGGTEVFSSSLEGNRANQVIADFPASTVDWNLARGTVSIITFSEGRALLLLRVKQLIIPAFGFNPSPDILARVVCHDPAGQPSEAARTKAVPFNSEGNAILVDV